MLNELIIFDSNWVKDFVHNLEKLVLDSYVIAGFK